MSATEGSAPAVDGRRRRWREHNEARREVIIDAAIATLEGQQPGEDLQVQAVADRAAISRTVVYRHFEDRADLERAVQRRICDDLAAVLVPTLRLDGTPDRIVGLMVHTFVDWASQHPTHYWFVDRDVADWGPSPLRLAIEKVAGDIASVMTVVVSALGVDLSGDDMAALDPWVFGMIGALFAAVRRWLERDVQEPTPTVLADSLSQSFWIQIDGLARSRGINLPDLPLTELLTMIGSSGTVEAER